MFKSRPKKTQSSKPNALSTIANEAADSSQPAPQTQFDAKHQAKFAQNGANLTNTPSPINPGKPGKKQKKTRLLPALDWTRWLRYLAIAAFAFACLIGVSFVLTWQTSNASVYKQKVGEAAIETAVAPKDITYVSPILTEKAKDEATTDPVNNIYQHDQLLISTNRERLTHLLDTLNTARSQPNLFGAVSANLKGNEDVQAAHLTDEQIQTMLAFSNVEWSDVNQQAYDTYNLMMLRDIHKGQLEDEINRLNKAVTNPWDFSLPFARLNLVQRKMVVVLVTPYLAENSPLDQVATQQRQQQARARVQPVQATLKKGQEIVRAGDSITPLQLEELAQFSGQTGAYNWQSTVGTVGLVATLLLLLLSYFSLLFNSVWGHPRILTFLGLLLVISAAAIRIAVSDPADHTLRPFLLPLATISLLLTALFDINLALFMTMVLALLGGYVGQSLEVAAVVFAGGTAGALSLWKAERTIVFAYAGAAIAAAQFVVALCFALVNHTLDFLAFGLLLAACSANALISTSLAFFSFSILGKFFGVTTVLSLLELAHPNQPLLRRLMREAPGTYHHSVLVSNLAEQAAEQVAGEALLARVGAYYHDIGKLARPGFFIDNQGGGANIHDTLDPRESAKIIRSHVSDGVELAHKHNLPKRVIDIIHQHHGTCMISFFYNKAVTQGLDVTEIDFRYPGPKPQTKIAAIVMLADGCEAAVRANVQSGRIPTGANSPVPGSPNPDPNLKKTSIEAIVNKIIDDRLADHQLDECNLTLRDIEEIRRLYTQILNDIYHPRISYPDANRPSTTSTPDPQVVQREGVVVTPVIAVLPAPAAPEPTELAAERPIVTMLGNPTKKLPPSSIEEIRSNPAATATLVRPAEYNHVETVRLNAPEAENPTKREDKNQLDGTPPTKNLKSNGGIGGAGRSVK